MDSEIMQVLLDEAREGYREDIVVELRSDKVEDVDGNVERVEGWVEGWRRDNAQGREEDEGEGAKNEEGDGMKTLV